MQVRDAGGGANVTVRVRTRARPRVEVADDDVVTVSVAAPPVEGRATEEARRALADALGVPGSAVTLRSGARSRTKVFHVAGIGAEDVVGRLRRRIR